MLANVRGQLQALNNVCIFPEGEWRRFVETYLDKPSDGIVDKTRKIHDDYIHDFVFDDGRIQNIYLPINPISPAIKFKPLNSSSKRVHTPTVMM